LKSKYCIHPLPGHDREKVYPIKAKTVLTFVLLIACVSLEARQPSDRKPNILVILADDLGYHDLSYYGTPDIRTPNIDMLCKAGMRFDNFYSNSPVCSPTRASLMSGRYPEMVGVPGLIRSNPDANFGFLKPDALLLPKLLKQADYNTALVGKWNLGLETPNTPNEKGFDFFHGFLDDMMNDYWDHLRNGKDFMRKNDRQDNPKGRHATDVFTGWAIDYIAEQKNNANPFFLYLAYNAPHFPVQPPEEWMAKVKARQPNSTETRAKLVALIEHMDDGIGKVIKALKETGAYDNTLIVFMSDNGGFLPDNANNGDLRDGKGSMYEGGIRVPAFCVWPNHIQPAAVSLQPAITMDIYPTLSEVAGITIRHKVDGISLLNVLLGKVKNLPERPLFFTRREGNLKFGGETIQAVINGDWKLLQNSPFEPYQLYNLHEDPKEERNLVSAELEQYKKLQLMLISQLQKGGSIPWQRPEKQNQEER